MENNITINIKCNAWPAIMAIRILKIFADLKIIKTMPKWFSIKAINMFSTLWLIPSIKRR